MKTEIDGNWHKYTKRFQLPPRRIWVLPLKWFGISSLIQVAAMFVAIYTNILVLIVSSMIVGAFLYAAGKEFWNIVLEESKGFWADVIMWMYYAFLFSITIGIPLAIGLKYLNLI